MNTPAAQWPPPPQQQQQQSQPSQSYNYAGYQQQYPQQQYPRQQHPQQQYAYSQPGSYPQIYQSTTPTNFSQVQQVPQSIPHTCYNCGSPEHWAQNCPEPRREVPAGAINHQSFPRPLKRQKTNAPIITKYPLPPHVAPPPGPPKGNGPTPYGQPGYAHNQGISVPPTPLSAQSAPPHQWPQPSQYQQYQQQYQQGYPYQQGASYQHQAYTAPTPITPNTYYGSQSQNHSPAQWPQHNAAYNPHSAQYQPPSGVPAQPYSSASPSSVTSPATGYQWNQFQGLPGGDPAAAHQESSASNILVQSQSSTPKPQPVDMADTEVEEDDLEKLDVPDIPSGGALIDLTGRPLSANFVVAEAIPILPPEPENDGCCRSKYTDRGKPDILGQNVKNTSYWEELSKDPIFLSVSDGAIVPIDYVKSLYDSRQANGEEAQEPENDDNNSQQSRFEINGEDAGDVMDSLEHALNAGRPNPIETSGRKSSSTTDQTPPRSNSWIPPARDTEAMLAALGVTGAPKPVRAPARPYPPPPAREPQLQASPNGTSGSGGGSPATYPTTNGQLPPGLAERSYSQNVEPPPPPPPPAWKPSVHDGTTGSPLSVGPSYGASNGHDSHTLENGHAYQKNSTDGQTASPIKIRAGGANARKRDFDSRDDSSGESETQERRQVDDVTPKLKRRQPRVAEAYSRRW